MVRVGFQNTELKPSQHQHVCAKGSKKEALFWANMSASAGDPTKLLECLKAMEGDKLRGIAGVIRNIFLPLKYYDLWFQAYDNNIKELVKNVWDMVGNEREFTGEENSPSVLERGLNNIRKAASKIGLQLEDYISRKKIIDLLGRTFKNAIWVMENMAKGGQADMVLSEFAAMERLCKQYRLRLRWFITWSKERQIKRLACREKISELKSLIEEYHTGAYADAVGALLKKGCSEKELAKSVKMFTRHVVEETFRETMMQMKKTMCVYSE